MAQDTFSDEQMIMASQDDSLVLTNKRVKYEAINGSNEIYRSIPLSKVSAVSAATKKYPLLMGLAVLALIGAVAAPNFETRIGAMAAAVVFALLYYFIKPGQLEITSDSGTSIFVSTKGLEFREVRRFAEAVMREVSRR